MRQWQTLLDRNGTIESGENEGRKECKDDDEDKETKLCVRSLVGDGNVFVFWVSFSSSGIMVS